jgi:hypothetical protein
MRIRFSLRTFFVLLTLLAFFCYLWVTRPSQIARRFADAVNAEDFAAADQMFFRSGDQFLAEWADENWAFEARCELRPLTIAQLLSARRHVDINIGYFELDHTASRQVVIAATPLGLNAPSVSSVKYGALFIDRSESPIPLR